MATTDLEGLPENSWHFSSYRTKGVKKSATPCNGSKMHFYAKTYRYIRGRMKLYETEADRAFYKL
jgi:hypothetical protein